jgi:chemotaxis family two-component system sensor kinase Cph1
LTPTASGVLSVKLSATRPDYLMWFRKEQLQTVTWAGDPNKPTLGDSPLELSPRRSFAAWSEIVRGTALPWTGAEVVLARAIGSALVDIILQVHAVRLLIGEHQLVGIRAVVDSSRGPVADRGRRGRLLHANPAFHELLGSGRPSRSTAVADLAQLFETGDGIRESLLSLTAHARAVPPRRHAEPSRAAAVPVSVRAEVVPGQQRHAAGLRADAGRPQRQPPRRRRAPPPRAEADAGRAAIRRRDPGDPHEREPRRHGHLGRPERPAVAPMLGELEESTQRAQVLYEQIRRLDRDA